MNVTRAACACALAIGLGLGGLTVGPGAASAAPGQCGPQPGACRSPGGPGGTRAQGPGDRGPGGDYGHGPDGPRWGARGDDRLPPPPPDLAWRGIDQGRYDHQPFNYDGAWVSPFFNPDFGNWGFWFLGIWIPL